MPFGPSMLLWAVGAYTVVQSIEGYVVGPLIQRQAVEIPPAWTLVAIVLLGSLFGVLGIALAMPLVAIGKAVPADSAGPQWSHSRVRGRFIR